MAFRLDNGQNNYYVVTDISGIIMCLHVLVWRLVEDAMGKMSSGVLVSVFISLFFNVGVCYVIYYCSIGLIWQMCFGFF